MAVSKKRKAFTLVELLVVISIIGMLMSLLLPAVQAAREAGRRSICANNLRQLGFATLNYESGRKAFPGYVNRFGANASDKNYENDFRVSWVVPVLPFVERSDIYDVLNEAENVDKLSDVNWEVTLSLVQCPSDASDTSASTSMSYVANAGKIITSSPGSFVFQDNKRVNGVFLNHFDFDEFDKRKNVGLGFLDSGDGSSTTLMLSENDHVRNWAMDPYYAPNITKQPESGFCWYGPEFNIGDGVEMGLLYGINREDQDISANAGNEVPDEYGRPFSNHPGGVNAVFCDGHVIFLSELTEYHVYRQLMTPKTTSGVTKGNNPSRYILDDADY